MQLAAVLHAWLLACCRCSPPLLPRPDQQQLSCRLHPSLPLLLLHPSWVLACQSICTTGPQYRTPACAPASKALTNTLWSVNRSVNRDQHGVAHCSSCARGHVGVVSESCWHCLDRQGTCLQVPSHSNLSVHQAVPGTHSEQQKPKAQAPNACPQHRCWAHTQLLSCLIGHVQPAALFGDNVGHLTHSRQQARAHQHALVTNCTAGRPGRASAHWSMSSKASWLTLHPCRNCWVLMVWYDTAAAL